jgi:glycosyltransferase involved in cell wall biosynthesis
VLLLSPIGTRVNPYIDLLRDGLVAAGADVDLAGRLDPDTLAGRSRPDVIHLHWLDRYDLPPALLARSLHGATDLPRRGLRRLLETAGNLPAVYQFRRWLRLRTLFDRMACFQAAGGRIVYTVHNLDPHEGAGPADRWGTARLLRLADAVHVHDASTAQEVATRFGRRAGVAIIPHGHYLGCYPNTIGRDEARQRLGLPAGAFVYVTLGLLRPYKGLEELLPAFRQTLQTLRASETRRVSQPEEANAILLLAGQPGSAEYAETLAALAGGDPRIRLTPYFVPPEDVQLYLNAADVCVLPYRQITTSGAALLAFSFGVPVIAPAIGAFPNLLADGRGVLYDPAAPAGLALALAGTYRRNWQGTQAKILAWVAQFDWQKIGKSMAEVYKNTQHAALLTSHASRPIHHDRHRRAGQVKAQ